MKKGEGEKKGGERRGREGEKKGGGREEGEEEKRGKREGKGEKGRERRGVGREEERERRRGREGEGEKEREGRGGRERREREEREKVLPDTMLCLLFLFSSSPLFSPSKNLAERLKCSLFFWPWQLQSSTVMCLSPPLSSLSPSGWGMVCLQNSCYCSQLK